MSLIKKAAIVTGASGGIGGACARALARAGYLTAVCYSGNKAAAEELVQELVSEHCTAKAFRCDISSVESMKECVAAVEEAFGGTELLVNCAGIADIGLFCGLSDERLCEIVETDLLGAMRLTRLVLPQMIRAHRGSVINISSVWGECGASCEVAYSAAKAGLIGFTKALAKECAPSGVRVNCVSCGLIDTKMNSLLTPEDISALEQEIPAGRMGTPEEAAAAVLFLAGESASYITGQVLRVDGGWI
ncbi:MAG: 3-oxoacyl-ACP reductase FabG [Ruminococcus sp.]|nr:3-oxoacyl-ACP reductase FabG [Ruminococcus sp.]